MKLRLEQLESRDCPSATWAFNPATATATFNHTPDNTPVSVSLGDDGRGDMTGMINYVDKMDAVGVRHVVLNLGDSDYLQTQELRPLVIPETWVIDCTSLAWGFCYFNRGLAAGGNLSVQVVETGVQNDITVTLFGNVPKGCAVSYSCVELATSQGNLNSFTMQGQLQGSVTTTYSDQSVYDPAQRRQDFAEQLALNSGSTGSLSAHVAGNVAGHDNLALVVSGDSGLIAVSLTLVHGPDCNLTASSNVVVTMY